MKLRLNPAIKKAGIFVIIIAVLVSSFFVYNGFTSKNAKAAVSYITYQVRNGNIQSAVSATGTLTAADSRDITAPNGSAVVSVNCTEGQAVKAGDVLFTLSSDSAQLDLEKSRLNLSQLKNSLNSLVTQLGSLSIDAPVSGIVKAINVGAGDSVSPQSSYQGGAVQIEDTSVMKFTVNSSSAGANKSLLDSLVPGQEIQASILGINGTRTVKVLSASSSQQGTSITFQVMNISGLTWDNYYSVILKVQDIDAELSSPVQVAGSLVNVNAKQSGTAASVNVKIGDLVSAGSRLVTVKNDNLSNQVQSAQVNIQSAQLDVNNKQSVIDSLTVKAPIDGMVHSIQAKVGDIIGSSSRTSSTGSQAGNVIASIENRSSMQVNVSVDELDIGKVKAGQDATITVDAFQGKTFQGKVVSIATDGTASNGTSTFQVKVGIDSPDGLMAGMTANVSIITASKENTLLLPVDAVQDRRGVKSVLISNNGKITSKEVTLGIVNTDNAEITSGLNVGDEVVIPVQTSSGTNNNNKQNNSMKIPGMGGSGFGGQSFGGSQVYSGNGSRGTGSNKTQNGGN